MDYKFNHDADFIGEKVWWLMNHLFSKIAEQIESFLK